MIVDKELIEEVKNSDAFAFERLVRTMEHQIFTYCCRMLGDIQEAEDAAQEVFIKVYERIDTYKKDISFSSWVYRIAHNHCINVIKRNKIFKFIPLHNIEEKIFDNRDVILGYEINEELKNALAILSPENKSILILRAVYNYDYEEIGAIINKNEALIRKRYERTKKKLEKYFKKIGGRIGNEETSII